jgi:hypothetical protein
MMDFVLVALVGFGAGIGFTFAFYDIFFKD